MNKGSEKITNGKTLSLISHQENEDQNHFNTLGRLRKKQRLQVLTRMRRLFVQYWREFKTVRPFGEQSSSSLKAHTHEQGKHRANKTLDTHVREEDYSQKPKDRNSPNARHLTNGYIRWDASRRRDYVATEKEDVR